MKNVFEIKTGNPVKIAAPLSTCFSKKPAPTPRDFEELKKGEHGTPLRAQVLHLLCMGHELTRHDALYHLGIANNRFSGTISALRNDWGIPITKRKKATKTNRVLARSEDDPEMKLIDTWRLPTNAPLALYYNILLAKGYRRPNGDRTVWPA